MRGQRIVQVARLGGAGQGVQMQGQLHQHALLEVAHRGHKDGSAGDAGVVHDFRQVLVRQAQGVQLEQRGFALLVGLDHGAPATRVAADRRQCQREISRDQARIHQGA
ncbi:hypothetical protein D3C72_1623970 [compost metagenome]